MEQNIVRIMRMTMIVLVIQMRVKEYVREQFQHLVLVKRPCFSVYHSCVDIKIDGNVCLSHFSGGDIQDKDYHIKTIQTKNYIIRTCYKCQLVFKVVPKTNL